MKNNTILGTDGNFKVRPLALNTKIMKMVLVQNKYNYPQKVEKALKENNQKYLSYLIKRGKLIVLWE